MPILNKYFFSITLINAISSLFNFIFIKLLIEILQPSDYANYTYILTLIAIPTTLFCQPIANYLKPNYIISISDFELTIKRISKFCNLNFLRPIEDLLPYHYENIKLQKFINQDLICNDILQATLGNENKVWESLPLTSEAWLQWQFRNLGYELKCYNLNTFPSNSEQLRELLYKI